MAKTTQAALVTLWYLVGLFIMLRRQDTLRLRKLYDSRRLGFFRLFMPTDPPPDVWIRGQQRAGYFMLVMMTVVYASIVHKLLH